MTEANEDAVPVWEPTKKKKKPGYWPLVLGVVIVLVWAVAGFTNMLREVAPHIHAAEQSGVGAAGEKGFVEGYVGGGALMVAAFVWAVIYFTMVKRRAPERGLPYFLILAVVSLAANFGLLQWVKSAARENDQQQGKVAVQELKSALKAVAADRTATIDTHVRATGDAGEAERIVKEMLVGIQQDSVRYQQELTKLGFPGLMAPRSLAHSDLTDVRTRIASARTLLSTYRDQVMDRVAATRAAAQKSNMSPGSKQGFIEGVDRSIDTAKARFDSVVADEMATFDELDAMAELLARHRGAWVVRGDRMLFTDTVVMKQYNTHVQRVAALEASLHDKQARMVAGAEAQLDAQP